MDGDDDESDHSDKCRTFLSAWLCPSEQVSIAKLHSLYISLLIGCLSSILACSKVELEKRKCSVDTTVEAPVTSVKNPPIEEKKTSPDQSGSCPYQVLAHDLSFLLDDGTLLTANREAVAGDEGAEEVGSEYFRALLRGGFGEACKSDSIPIRDVSQGMLLPVLHYLHGCRTTADDEAVRCPVLASLATGGLKGHEAFQKSPLAELMTGASRFLVPGLQKAAEDLCVSLLSSVPSSCKSEDLNKKTKPNLGSACRDLNQLSKIRADAQTSGQRILSKCSEQRCKVAEPSSVKRGAELDSLRTLLPQAYAFSQCFCYSRLGRACLFMLLQPQEVLNTPLSASLRADCLLRLVREADSRKSLRQDLLGLATAALS